jgi:hypothetical protein
MNNKDTAMKEFFIEYRRDPSVQSGALAADIAQHLQSRQYLGRALIICDNPAAILSAVRKQWLKAARKLLKLRPSTLNAEEILRLTHVIMHMQTIQFIAKPPADVPDATIYFAEPDHSSIPDRCYTVYVVGPLSPPVVEALHKKLPPNALIVSYIGDMPGLPLRPKQELEARVLTEWDALVGFLARHDVHPSKLVVANALQFGAMEQALDTLLGVAESFLHQAARFQRAINLAQPLTLIAPTQQKTFEAVTRLAHRVQDLTPGNFNHYLVGTFDDSAQDAFFLRDAGSELYKDLENAAAKTHL